MGGLIGQKMASTEREEGQKREKGANAERKLSSRLFSVVRGRKRETATDPDEVLCNASKPRMWSTHYYRRHCPKVTGKANGIRFPEAYR